MSIDTYYEKLNALWEELSILEPPIVCPCSPSCTVFDLHNAVKPPNYMNF